MHAFVARLLIVGLIAMIGTVPVQDMRAAPAVPPPATQPERLVDIKLVLNTLTAVADSHIAAMANALVVASVTQDVRSLNWEKMKPLLAAIQERFGPAVVWYAQPDGAYYTVDVGLTDKNLKDRAYFPKVMAGETAIGELVISKSTGSNTVIVATPIQVQGQVVGLLGASVYLDHLVDNIKKIAPLPADAVFYALDAQGRIALHTQEGLIFQEAMQLGSPTLAEAVKQMLANQVGGVTYEFAGGQQQAVYQTSPLTGWKFAIRFPAE